jgi:uncharacterized protein (TIGR02145 family)
LDKNLNNSSVCGVGSVSKYKSVWSCSKGGYCNSDGNLCRQGSIAVYWSSTEISSLYGHILYLPKRGYVSSRSHDHKRLGFQVRCVK